MGIPYEDGFSSKKVLANVRKHHHFEDWREKSFVLRTAMLVSASKDAGLLKETVKV